MDEQCEELSRLFDRAENRLKEIKILRDVWIDCQNGNAFGMAKVDGRWRLAYSDGTEIKPISNRPITDRISVVNLLKLLHAKILEANQQIIPELEQAIDGVAEFLAGLAD